jgi:lipopolysaccharide transport system permease protein
MKINKIKYFSDLLFVLTQKELKARYKHALLGFLWVFLIPLIQMLVLGFVFSIFLKFNIKNYYLFLFTGLLPWNFFSLALNKATPRIIFDRSLIQKSKFPRSSIPLSMILSYFIHFLASLLLLLIYLIITKQWYFFSPINLSFIIVGILLLLIFTIGLSLITSALNVFYRDIAFAVQAGIMFWFYLTPIIYPFSAIPDNYQQVFYLNPLLTVFSFLQKPVIDFNLPANIIFFHILIIFLTCIVGFYVFRKKEKYFADFL